MKLKAESDDLRAEYLQICEQLIGNVQNMRNFAMKPGNAWLAKAEMAKINNLLAEAETLLDQIKQADQG
jgi:hypothetical protein